MDRAQPLTRNDGRVIIHFDYDCFYASVFEAANPALKSQPLAVQQKQIVVTCNYEARKRGLRKLQLITEAKNVCPEVVIVLGEDLTRFRNASKDLYNFLQSSIWSGQAERLGFDEVFLDCTDMVDYNVGLVNHNDPGHAFFCLDKTDPAIGFGYDASSVCGPAYPDTTRRGWASDDFLFQRLVLGSHLARYLRQELENEHGYTAAVGISTNKLLSKLVGNVNKPNGQTTLLPPYEPSLSLGSNITIFMDPLEIGRVPGVGLKLSQKIRARVLGRQPQFDEGLVYGGTKETVTVHHVRTYPGMGSEMLEDILSGPGSQKGGGGKIWRLLHGIDDTQVSQAKKIPSQISVEDSYTRLDTFEAIKKELNMLSTSLIRRMHLDLMEAEHELDSLGEGSTRKKWLAHPRTLRLSTRPRPATNPDGSRSRSFNRIYRSVPMPNFALSLTENIPTLAERLVQNALIPAFKKLHPEKSGWNLSLVNIAVTNMAATAADTKDSRGRDISRMFRTQDDVLKEWRVADVDMAPDMHEAEGGDADCVTDGSTLLQNEEHALWDSDDGSQEDLFCCDRCGACVPSFAVTAHKRFHDMPD